MQKKVTDEQWETIWRLVDDSRVMIDDILDNQSEIQQIMFEKKSDAVFWLLGLGGEIGELQNKFHKLLRNRQTLDISGLPPDVVSSVEGEFADILIFLLLLAKEAGVNLGRVYQRKMMVNRGRHKDGYFSRDTVIKGSHEES